MPWMATPNRISANGRPIAKKRNRAAQAEMPAISTKFMFLLSAPRNQGSESMKKISIHWPMVITGPTVRPEMPDFSTKRAAKAK